MSDDPLYEIRREAQDRGLRWADVADAYREIKALEWEKRQRPNEVRQHAWMMATASVPGCWSFWRHGFSARWGRKLAKGQDYTCVPGYDEIGQQIGTAFAEYGGDDGTEQLFEFLFSPYDKLPERTELYRKALEMAGGECRMENGECRISAVPF